MNSLARTVHTEPLGRHELRPSAQFHPLRELAAAAGSAADWPRGAAIYRIYPRSFQDSNGDGHGDLRGITLRLPYVAALGVDALWISPFFSSPINDFGDDRSGYCDVDPQLGTPAHFDALLTEAHHLGLKVLIDLAPDHAAAVFWMARGVDGFLPLAGTCNPLAQGCSPRSIHRVLDESLREAGPASTCWTLNNHDVSDVTARWQALGGRIQRVAPLLMAMLSALRGSICIQQGEELGLAGRAPMPWQVKRLHAGFSTAPPWLPVPDPHRAMAVDVQLQAPQSVLRRYQEFLHWRQRQPALREGSMTLLPAHDQVVAFERCTKGERVLCAFNLSAHEARLALPIGMSLCKMQGHGFNGRIELDELVLPAHDGYFGRVERRQMPLG